MLTPLAHSPPPSLVVFDLDFTLWQRPRFRGGPPFVAVDGGAGGVRASCGATLYLYPGARRALAALADARVPVAIASRTHRGNWARQWLGMLTIDESGRTVDDAIDGWPIVVQDGPKRGHLRKISDMSGVPLNEFLFFDDDLADVAGTEKLDVTSQYVPAMDRRLARCGLTDELFDEGLRRYAEQSKLGRRSGSDAWTREQQNRALVQAKRDVLRLRYGGKQR